MKVKMFLLISLLLFGCKTFTEENTIVELKIETEDVINNSGENAVEFQELDLDELKMREKQAIENLKNKVKQLFYQTGNLVTNSDEILELKKIGYAWCNKVTLDQDQCDECKKSFIKLIVSDVVFKEMENQIAIQRKKFDIPDWWNRNKFSGG